MTPEETIAAYRRQSRQRLVWFGAAVALAVVTATVAKLAIGTAYPLWRLALLVWGLLYVPWFVAQVYHREHVFLSTAMKAKREISERRGER